MELLFRLFMVLEAKPVIAEHPAAGQKDVTILAVWWSRQGEVCRKVQR